MLKVTRLGPPPMEDFSPDQMMPKKLKAFQAWHASIPADYVYSYADELLKYAKQDTKLLMCALLAYRRYAHTLRRRGDMKLVQRDVGTHWLVSSAECNDDSLSHAMGSPDLSPIFQ